MAHCTRNGKRLFASSSHGILWVSCTPLDPSFGTRITAHNTAHKYWILFLFLFVDVQK